MNAFMTYVDNMLVKSTEAVKPDRLHSLFQLSLEKTNQLNSYTSKINCGIAEHSLLHLLDIRKDQSNINGIYFYSSNCSF